ncbi:MAG: PhoH family protein, partial [Bacteroidales bacterium]|nr:PhoH family protein [Bacteroidales bacterium]
MPKKAKKTFVVDTNVLLHDYKCIYNFEENDVVIPIVVLEELDRFKRGNDLINFHAREFTRELDKLSGDDLFNGGISLGEDMGMLSIETGKPYSDLIKKSFPEDTPDHRILAIAEHLHIANQKKNVVLISKDINLRMKAKAIGIIAQDYKNDKVANIDELYKGISMIEGMGTKLISRMYEEYEGVPVQDFNFETKPAAHQYYILKNGKSSALAHYDPFNDVMDRVEKQKAYGIDPRNAEQAFALDALMRPEVQLVSLTGKAGTGKTLLALAAALYQRKLFTQIFLARPIVPLANRDMGFLPGDVKEKIEPYMQPLMDNLSVIKHKF